MQGVQTCVCNGRECVVADAVVLEPVSGENSRETSIGGEAFSLTCFVKRQGGLTGLKRFRQNHFQQNSKPALLRLIKTFVERPLGIGQLL
jgi:hypothetical protein